MQTIAPAISIKQLRAIAAISEQTSMVAASHALSISQSSLSRQLGEAEDSLQRKLFQRGWNGIEPTSAGGVVIIHCRRMMARIERLGFELSQAGAKIGDLSYHLTWAILEAVDAVHTTGSASSAAQDLGISQPTVSRMLAQAGAATGRGLFKRAGSGMKAGTDAQLLVDLRKDLLAELSRMTGALSAMEGQVTGRLAIGLLPFSEQDIVIETFAVLMNEYPHLRLQAVTGSYTALTDALRRDEIDMMLGPLRGANAMEWIEEFPLMDEELTLLVRPGHPLADKRASVEALAEATWVVGPHGSPTRRFFERFFLERGIVPPAQVCEMVTFPLAEEMVLRSDAIGLLTYSARRRKHWSGRLSGVASDFPREMRKIGISSSRNRPVSAPQTLFRETLLDCISGSPRSHER